MAQQVSDPENETLFSAPVGAGTAEIGYEEGGNETVPWGPTALTVDEDGTFFIVDGANRRIQHYDASGSHLGSLAFGRDIVGVTDVKARNGDLFLLDTGSIRPAVHRLALDSLAIRSQSIPERLGPAEATQRIAEADVVSRNTRNMANLLWGRLDSIHIGPEGAVYGVLPDQRRIPLMDEGGSGIDLQAADALGQVASRIEQDGEQYTFQNADWSVDPRTGYIIARDPSGESQRITVKMQNALGSLRHLPGGNNGGFYVVVEEVSIRGLIRVDQTVRSYDSEGRLLGVARIPLDQFHVPVENGITVGSDGSVYALVPKKDHIEVQRLVFTPRLAMVLPSEESPSSRTVSPETAVSVASAPMAELAEQPYCRSSETMMRVAEQYVRNWKFLTAQNTDGTCSYRQKPRYLASQGWYPSVAYDAGGYDTVADYNNYLTQGYQAGDISWGDPDPCCAECSRGVDCSGFVTRVWNQFDGSGKLTTSTIPNYSWELSSKDALYPGDVLNWIDPNDPVNSHVVVFAGLDAGSRPHVYHSTQYNHYDRVIKRTHQWSDFNHYVPRRYNNACYRSVQGLSFEAEVFRTLTPRSGYTWSSGGSIPGYSAWGYMEAVPAEPHHNIKDGYKDTSPALMYEIDFPEMGTYYIWIRGYGTSGEKDSIHAGIDGLAPQSARAISCRDWRNGYWAWCNTASGGERARISVGSGGIHTFHLWMRENGFIVDRVVLTKDAGYNPYHPTIGPFEAEHFDDRTSVSGHEWVFEQSTQGFRGDGYLKAMPNSDVTVDTGYVQNSPELIYTVDFPEPGNYYVWIRGNGENGHDDSVHAGIDGTGPASADRMSGCWNPAGWRWCNMTMDNNHSPATIWVPTAGLHSFHLWMRED